MRLSDTATVSALEGSLNHRWSANIVYNGETRLRDVPIDDVSFKEDSGSAIEMSGSCTVVWANEFGDSISPTEIGDILSPFGPELHLFSMVTVGPSLESRIPIGQFPITNVPSALDADMRFRGEWITTGSTVRLEFKDSMAKVSRDRFDVPSAPLSLDSVWGEVSRITDMAVLQGVADKPITRSVMYQENRLDAVRDLLELLDAVPHVTSFGALSARSNVWGEPVATLRRGDRGQVVSVGRAMSAEAVYNRVAFRGKANDQQKILAFAEVTSGPLRVRNLDGTPSPYGRRTKFLSSDLVTTVDQAQEWCDRELPRASRIGVVELPVVETFNPLRERGDVVRLELPRKTLIGRVASISRGMGATQALTVEVSGG